jgi:hypothetical protein
VNGTNVLLGKLLTVLGERLFWHGQKLSLAVTGMATLPKAGTSRIGKLVKLN